MSITVLSPDCWSLSYEARLDSPCTIVTKSVDLKRLEDGRWKIDAKRLPEGDVVTTIARFVIHRRWRRRTRL